MIPTAIASIAGMSPAEYYDCEENNDLISVVPLRKIRVICDLLKVSVARLYVERDIAVEDKITFSEVSLKIKEHLSKERIDVDKFSNDVGFEVEPALEDPEAIGEWPVEWLEWICDKVGVEWWRVLP